MIYLRRFPVAHWHRNPRRLGEAAVRAFHRHRLIVMDGGRPVLYHE
jgi:hypothetical protein